MDTFVLDLLLKVKSLLDYTNLFSLNDYDKNDKMILKYFNNDKDEKIVLLLQLFAVSIENMKNLKYHTS